jgi:hypothetical protein
LAFPRRVESTPQGTIGFLWGKVQNLLWEFLAFFKVSLKALLEITFGIL